MDGKVNKEKESELIKNFIKKKDLLKENKTLKKRCKALTKGYLCAMCSFDCEDRAQQQLKGTKGGKNDKCR